MFRAIDQPRQHLHYRQLRSRRGYSLLELCMTILIIQMITGMVSLQISSVITQERLNYAAQEVVTALRYARQLAQTTGNPCSVYFDQAGKRIVVSQTVGTTAAGPDNPVSCPQMFGGKYSIDLNGQTNVRGVSISSVDLTPTGTTYVKYGSIGTQSQLPRGLGSTTNAGSITLACGSARMMISIPAAGDAKIIP